MQKLTDKLVLLGLCLLALSLSDIRWLSIVVMLIALAVSSLCDYFENKAPMVLCAAYAAACLIIPEFTVFLPLVVYD